MWLNITAFYSISYELNVQRFVGNKYLTILWFYIPEYPVFSSCSCFLNSQCKHYLLLRSAPLSILLFTLLEPHFCCLFSLFFAFTV